MISIDESFVERAAPNADAARNGRGLFVKGKFSRVRVDSFETIIFGACEGSGKEPYEVSCDFQRADLPTYRCSCPSRQFPCKHALGLMFAFVLNRKAFTVGEVPAALAEKREKLATRAVKRVEEPSKPKSVNKSALSKKIKAQLDGLDLLEKLKLDLTRIGIGNMNAKSAGEIEEKAKQLGNAYLPGAQAALLRYTQLFAEDDGEGKRKGGGSHSEAIYSEALDHLTRLHALVKLGRVYLHKRLEDPELKPETETGIAAWLGHAWQLAELREAGLVERDVELMQLAFNSHDDAARREFVDTGIWMNLNSGRVQITQNFRPYKSVKYIRSDDSFFGVAQVAELCVYPGDVNRRIRWEAMTERPAEARDFARVRGHARGAFAEVIKEVKNSLKGALGDRQPVYALRYKRLGEVNGVLVAEDAQGERLVMTDAGMSEEQPSCHLLSLLPEALHEDQTLIARFGHDLDRKQLQIKPLSVVGCGDRGEEARAVRLTL